METIAIRDILITPQQELKIDKKSTMKFLSRINAGSFGGIFKGQLDEKNKRTGRIQKERVVVKIEAMECDYPQLSLEHGFYSHIHERHSSFIDGIPFFYRFLKDVQLEYRMKKEPKAAPRFGRFNCLVIEELGLDLSDVRKKFDQGLPFGVWVDLIMQIFDIMKNLFKRRIIHRDIKPCNFMLGHPEEKDRRNRGPESVFIVDFGLAKITQQTKNGKIVRMERNKDKGPIGTKTYMSEYVMNRDTPHMRDDLISCCYVFREMTDRPLPWNDMEFPCLDRKEMLKRKKALDGAALFGQTDNPRDYFFTLDRERTKKNRPKQPDISAMIKLFDYIKNLNWDEEPDFERIDRYVDEMSNLEANQTFMETNNPWWWDPVLEIVNK
jgi:serine/threonine protein kinase